MSPTNAEYWAQLVPNWNSMTRPEATPTTKVRAKIRVQNAAARSYVSAFPWRFRTRSVSSTRTIAPIPIEMLGKKKWNPMVIANWIRASCSTSTR